VYVNLRGSKVEDTKPDDSLTPSTHLNKLRRYMERFLRYKSPLTFAYGGIAKTSRLYSVATRRQGGGHKSGWSLDSLHTPQQTLEIYWTISQVLIPLDFCIQWHCKNKPIIFSRDKKARWRTQIRMIPWLLPHTSTNVGDILNDFPGSNPPWLSHTVVFQKQADVYYSAATRRQVEDTKPDDSLTPSTHLNKCGDILNNPSFWV
jgi:hypothetical protein